MRDAILGLRLVIEKQIDRNKITYLAFIGIEKAFNNVDWNLIINEIKKIGINQLDIRISYNLYKNQQVNIKNGNSRNND